MQCPQCDATVDPQAKFCPSCGAALKGETKRAATPADAMRSAAGREDEPERDLWQGGYSGKTMVGTWILLGLVTVALVVGAVVLAGMGFAGLPETGVLVPIVLGIAVVLWLIGAAVFAYRRMSVHYKVTTQRLIHRHGLLSRVTDRIELIDVDDITYRQGLVERMFNVGTIQIQSSDATHPELELRGIDDVAHVADVIDDARRRERRRRGLHIEAI